MSSSDRSEQNLLVTDLEPNTKYEFAIRLHIDQLSSPWSPVVYQSTFPDGELIIIKPLNLPSYMYVCWEFVIAAAM